jgi:hypothetical protein
VNRHGDFALDIGKLNALDRKPLDPDGEDRTGGNHVVCARDTACSSRICKAGSLTVSAGDQVAVGQLLGKMGNSMGLTCTSAQLADATFS